MVCPAVDGENGCMTEQYKEIQMVKLNHPTKPVRFSLGQVVATPAALDLLNECHQTAIPYLRRHASGDWGDLCDEDKRLNDEAIAHEGDPERMGRVLSFYTLPNGKKIWIISEADRSSTCVLLPSDY
jgi:hypothetical protein